MQLQMPILILEMFIMFQVGSTSGTVTYTLSSFLTHEWNVITMLSWESGRGYYFVDVDDKPLGRDMFPSAMPSLSREPSLAPTSLPSKLPSLLPTSSPTGNSYLDYTFDVAANEITIEYHFDPSLSYRYIAVYDASVIQDVSQSYVNSQSFWSSSKCMRQFSCLYFTG